MVPAQPNPSSTTVVTRIKSYEIPVESAKSAGQGKASGPGGPGGPGGQGKADAAKVLGRLEQLEKAVAQDSVREVGRKYLVNSLFN